MENQKIGIFTCVCERDMIWFAQFTKQAEILGYPVAWFADHLSPESLQRLRDWPGSVFIHDNQNEQFSERSKQVPFLYLKGNGFDWAIQMDIDETWEKDAKQLIENSLAANPDKHIADCDMVTVVKEDGQFFQRVDQYFIKPGREGHRERIYNLKYEWRWIDPITCGAYLVENEKVHGQYQPFDCPAASVHWGYSTYDLCDEHKKKWTDVYTKVWGKMPYQGYEMLTDRTHERPLVPLADKFYKHL